MPSVTVSWKESRFNAYVPADGGVTYIANTLSRGIARCPSAQLGTITGAVLDDHGIASFGLQELAANGFLVPCDSSELETFKEWFDQIRLDLSEIRCTVALTSACNLSCKYCYQRGALQALDTTMSPAIADKLLDWLTAFADYAESESVVIYFYGGEPTLTPNLIDRIATEASRRIGSRRHLSFGIYTNGVDIPEELSALCLSDDLVYAQVSLDGPPAVHNERRPTRDGHPTFHRTWNTIGSLAERGTEVKVVVNFDNENRDHIPELLDMVAESSFSRSVVLAFNPVFRAVGNIDYCKAHSPTELESYRIWQQFYLEAAERNLRSHWPRLFSKGPCSFHRLGHIVVAPQGSIHECVGLPGHEEFATAMVLERFTPSLLDHRRRWIETHTMLREECAECRYLPICLGGCRFQALSDTGDLSGQACHKQLIEQCELPLIPAIAGQAVANGAANADR